MTKLIGTAPNQVPTNADLGKLAYQDAIANGTGTAGQVLQSGGATGSPTWVDAGGGVPAGSVIYHAANSAPTGFLKANGAAVSRSTYAALFTAIGTTFGVGDGSSTFNVPDLRGEFPRGWDDSRGVDSGRSFGSAQADELKAHTHLYRDPISGSTPTGAGGGTSKAFPTANSGTTSSTGGSETRPRNIALLACIKH